MQAQLQDVLEESQQQEPDDDLNGMLQTVQRERVRRVSAKQLQAPGPAPAPAPDAPLEQPQQQDNRWSAPKSNSVTQNANTVRANKTAVTAFASWLVSVKQIQTDPVELAQEDFKQLLAEFVLQVGGDICAGARQPGLASARNCMHTRWRL